MNRCLVSNLVVLLVSFAAFSIQSVQAQDDKKLDAYTRYVESLLKVYDKDKDGSLDQEELNSMRRPPVDADQNGDNKVSKQEFIVSLSKKSNRSSRNSNSRSSRSGGYTTSVNNLAPKLVAVRLELFEIQNDVEVTAFAEFVYNLPLVSGDLDQEIKKLKDQPGITKVASCNCVTGIDGRNFWDNSNRDFGFRNELQFRVLRTTPNVELELSWEYEKKSDAKQQKSEVVRVNTKSPKQFAGGDELEKLIIQKIEEKKQEMARKKAREKTQSMGRPKHLKLGTQLVCGEHGASAIFVNEHHSKWLVILQTKTH